jgi:hypothetical protein
VDCQEEGADVEQEKNREDGLEVHREEGAQQTSLHSIGIVGSTACIECSYGVWTGYKYSRKSESTLHLASQP